MLWKAIKLVAKGAIQNVFLVDSSLHYENNAYAISNLKDHSVFKDLSKSQFQIASTATKRHGLRTNPILLPQEESGKRVPHHDQSQSLQRGSAGSGSSLMTVLFQLCPRLVTRTPFPTRQLYNVMWQIFNASANEHD